MPGLILVFQGPIVSVAVFINIFQDHCLGFVFRGKKLASPVKKPAPKVKPTIRTTRSQDLMKGMLNPTLSYQNLLFCRAPINSILGFIITTYKKVGYGSLRKTVNRMIAGS